MEKVSETWTKAGNKRCHSSSCSEEELVIGGHRAIRNSERPEVVGLTPLQDNEVLSGLIMSRMVEVDQRDLIPA